MNPEPEFPAQRASRFPWGCLIGGCLTVFVLMIGGVITTGFVGYSFYKKQIAKYTSETRIELPVAEVSEEQLAEIEQRVEAFQTKVEHDETPEQLILSDDDINALISKEESLRGRVYVTIKDGRVSADVSMPTDVIPGAKGRFFNGSVTVEATLERGVLIVTAQEASVNGEPIPESFMQGIRKENLAKDVYKNPENVKILQRFESLVIEGDKIILTPIAQEVSQEAREGTKETVEPSSESPGADASPSEAKEESSEAKVDSSEAKNEDSSEAKEESSEAKEDSSEAHKAAGDAQESVTP